MNPEQKIFKKSFIFIICLLMGCIHSSCMHMTSNRIEFVSAKMNYGATEYTFYNHDSTKAIIAILSAKNQHLYYADLDALEYTQITFGDNFNFDVYISPDDQFMAYSSLDNRKGRKPKLRIMDLAYFENMDISPIKLEGWNPLIHDSNVYFTNYVYKNDIRKGANIFKYSIFEKTLVQLTTGKNYDIVVDVDPKSELLYFMRGTRYYFASPVGSYRWDHFYYHKINLIHNETIQISPCRIPGSYQERISYDGNYALQYSLGSIYLVNLISGDDYKLLPKEGVLEYETRFADFNKVTYPVFHPSKDKLFLCMAIREDGEREYSSKVKNIYSMDYVSMEFEQIGNFSKDYISRLTISSDGIKIFFRTTRAGNKGPLGIMSIRLHDLWLYDIENDELTQLKL